MVVRAKKQNRKYLGRRSWGAGNIKNNRGAGDRGGVGAGGKKHKFTRAVVTGEGMLGSKGFTPWGVSKLSETNIGRINEAVVLSSEQKPVIELRGFKVLSSGTISRAASIKANAFSKKAIEKIQAAGGEAITYNNTPDPA
ncbi:MAG: uL15 family ribosomal protein [Candidatus Marsarchaeota archaeon]|jgi:large subunit ribosomal protein L15|nr:uL15 family ribosomal protein [Candidatus Marsarchaeota archaeon]